MAFEQFLGSESPEPDASHGFGRVQTVGNRKLPRNFACNGQGIAQDQSADPRLGRGKGDRSLERSRLLKIGQ
jgi:hypothetical protein